MNKYDKLNAESLAGIELNIEILILVLLWINNYHIAFWILSILSLFGVIIKIRKIDSS